MVWSCLGQVLRDGKEASCQGAVARVVVHQQQTGGATPTSDTGDYCRARAKLATAVLRRLTLQVGRRLEEEAPAAWRWLGRHVVLVDGFTVSLPDTEENQAVYPQPDICPPSRVPRYSARRLFSRITTASPFWVQVPSSQRPVSMSSRPS